MRFRSVLVVVALAVVSAGLSSLATWQLAERQFAAEDVLTLPVAAGPGTDRPMRFRVKVDDAKVRVYRTPEDRMGADVSVRVVAVQRNGEWVLIGNP